MFQHISDLIDKILDFIPRLDVTPETHATIAYRKGKAILFESGTMHFYWPIWTELETLPVIRQTLNLQPQVLTSSDGGSFIIGGIVVYEISNPLNAATKVHDVDDALRDMALSAMQGVFLGISKGIILEKINTSHKILVKELSANMRGMGVKIHKFFISDFAFCKTHRVIGDDYTIPTGDEEE